MLPSPFDGAATLHPYTLVHLVRLTREPHLVNLERRKAIRRNLEVDLECMRRSRNFRSGKEGKGGMSYFLVKRADGTHLDVHEPRSAQLPDECIFGISHRSIWNVWRP
jgi:hypothetical protein